MVEQPINTRLMNHLQVLRSARWGIAASALLVGGVGLPALGVAQEEAPNRIVANQVAVSQRDASLTLELEDGQKLEVTFRNGTVEVNGDAVGSFEREDALDASWRDLLGSAVGVSNGPLASLLASWDAPESLDGAQSETARLLDQTLETFVAGEVAATAADAPAAQDESPSVSADVHIDLRQVLRSRDLLRLLGDLEDVDLDLDDLKASIGEDLTIRRGERVDGDVLVIGGDLDVRGEIDGNVVVVDGRVRLYEGGEVDGNIQLVDASFSDYGGTLAGETIRVRADRTDEFEQLRDELRNELRVEIRDELESELHDSYDWVPRRGIFNPFRHFWAGLMGLFQNVLTFGLLAGIGAVLLYFNPERMADVVETARTSTAKSTVVGIAGSFLFFPVWILGIVVLAISIIGIPFLLLWVPLFPLVGGLAALFGMFAVASVVGEWAQERQFRFLEWADDPNAFYRMVSGLLVLTALFAGANVLRMGGPLLGFFHGLLAFIACVVSVGVILTGFGAVLLTWSANRTRYRSEFDEDWSWREWAPRAKRKASEAADRAADKAKEAASAVSDMMDDATESVDDVAEELDETIEDIQDALDDLGDDEPES